MHPCAKWHAPANERVSGVPVLEDGRLLGIVMKPTTAGTNRDRRARHRPVVGASSAPRTFRYIKARDESEGPHDPEIVSVAEDTPLDEIATLFDSRGIRRVPVVRAGKVTGIVTRASLVRPWQHPAKPRRRREKWRGDPQRLVAELEPRLGGGRTGRASRHRRRGAFQRFGLPGQRKRRSRGRGGVPVRSEDHRQRYSDHQWCNAGRCKENGASIRCHRDPKS
jgi:hypothetical protein